MANQFIARKGLIALADSQITGSLNISQNIVAGGTVQATFDASTATAISGAFDSVSSSLATRIASQEAFSSSLDATFATDAQVATAVAGLNAASSSYLLNTTDTFTGTLHVDGSIGIGTSSPAYGLHISKGTTALRLDNAGAEELSILPGFSTFGVYFQNYNRNTGLYEKETHRALEYVYNGGGNQERMRIDTSGNMSITSGVLNLGSDSVASYVNAIGDVLVLDVDSDNNSGGTPNIQFKVGGSAKAYLNGTGLGIGESGPLGKLHIKGSDTGVSSPSAQGNLLVLEDSENGLSILSSTAGAGYINFGDSDDNNVGMIVYGHSSNSMAFWTNAGQRMLIDSSGQTRFKSGTDYIVGLNRAGTDEWWLKAYTDGRFALHENGVQDQVTVLAGGNVGIGTTSPGAKLHVNGRIKVTEGDVMQLGSMAEQYPYRRLDSFEHDGSGYFWGFGTKYGSTQKINAFFVGQARTFHAVDSLQVVTWTANEYNTSYPTYSVKASIDSDGMKFNGDTAAANALNDYEEGTFTVTNNGDPTGVLGTTVGEYTKIGRLVFIRIVAQISSNFTYNYIGGLPFTVGGNSAVSSLYGATSVINNTVSNLSCSPITGTTAAYFYTNTTTAAPLTTSMAIVRLSFTYYI